jgi:hypothetical protein
MRSGDDAKLERWVEKKQLTVPVINDETVRCRSSGR